MKTTLHSVVSRFALALLVGAASFGIHAQTYPSKPIRLLVPMPPGGGTDFWARLTSAKMSESLGQPIVVENRPGASGILAAEVLIKSPADGYTLMIGDSAGYAVNASLYKKLPYDAARDFAPVTLTSRHALVLVAIPGLPANTVREFIAYAKSKPGEINFGSAGNGSPHHLAMELLMQKTGIKLNHVPYKGGAPVAQDLIAGRLPVAFLDLPSALPHLKAGKIKALAVASAKRIAPLPDLVTVSESGVPGFEADAWQGLAAPAGTPASVLTKLNEAYAKAVADPEVKRKLLDVGIEPTPSSSQDFSAYMKSEALKWNGVVKEGKITAE